MIKAGYKNDRYSMPCVSVIIPAYNAENYIRQAIFSVLHQTIDCEVEIIIINDCSSDHTDSVVKEIIYEFQQNEHSKRCICYINNETNLGVAESRNCGVRMATGEYIAFLDADDWWDASKLEKQFQLIESTRAVLCATGRELVRPDGESTGRYIGIQDCVSYKALLKTNTIPCSSVVLRTDIAREFPMCHDELHEDYILWLRVLEKYGDAVGINEPLLKSRMSEGGKSRNKFKSARMQFGVYRYLGFGLIESLYYFCNYAIQGVLKYHG